MQKAQLLKYKGKVVQVDFLDHVLSNDITHAPVCRAWGKILKVKKDRIIMTWWWFPNKKDKILRGGKNIESMVIVSSCITSIKRIKCV